MAEYMGWQRYLVLRPETTWNTHNPSAPTLFLPYTEYSVSAQIESIQPQYFLGERQRKSNRILRANVAGGLSLPMLGVHVSGQSIAERLIRWAMSAPRSAFLDSMTALMSEAGVDDKMHTGLRVASMTISGDSGGGLVNMQFSLQGGREYGSEDSVVVPPLSVTAPPPVEFAFSDVDFYIAFDETEGSLVASEEEKQYIDSFTITVENQLEVKHRNEYWPQIIAAGPRNVSLQFSFDKSSSIYDRLRRTGAVTDAAARLVMRGPHLGTASGTYTVVEAHFDRLNFSSAADQAAIANLVTQQVDWIALNPTSTSNDLDFFFSTA